MLPQKLKPSPKQKRNFIIHLIVFAIATIIMFMVHHQQGKLEWAYPWHAWIIAAWGLAVIGHLCAVFFSYEDKGHIEYQRQ